MRKVESLVSGEGGNKKNKIQKKSGGGFFSRIFGGSWEEQKLHKEETDVQKKTKTSKSDLSEKLVGKEAKPKVKSKTISDNKATPGSISRMRTAGMKEIKRRDSLKDYDIGPIWPRYQENYSETMITNAAYFERYLKRTWRGLEVRRGVVLDRHEYSNYWKNLIRAVYSYEAFVEKTAKSGFWSLGYPFETYRAEVDVALLGKLLHKYVDEVGYSSFKIGRDWIHNGLVQNNRDTTRWEKLESSIWYDGILKHETKRLENLIKAEEEEKIARGEDTTNLLGGEKGGIDDGKIGGKKKEDKTKLLASWKEWVVGSKVEKSTKKVKPSRF